MKVNQFLNSRKKWCKFNLARTKDGIPCNADHQDASQFCLMGAVARCYPRVSDRIAARLRLKLAIARIKKKKIGSVSIAKFNDADSTTFKKIKQVLSIADI